LLERCGEFVNRAVNLVMQFDTRVEIIRAMIVLSLKSIH